MSVVGSPSYFGAKELEQASVVKYFYDINAF